VEVGFKIVSGGRPFFWHDPWLGRVPLGVRFKSLFELVVDKSCTVSLMSAIGGMRGEAWRWRRRLWILEEDMLGECVILLDSVSLQFNVTDS
jgi:hypothetical protein